MAQTKAVLIVGSSGAIGTHLALKLRDSYKVFAAYYRHRVQFKGVTSVPIDVANQNWIKRLIYTARPEVIIYAAGRDNVEWAETNQKEAEAIHTEGAGNVASAGELYQPKFIYFSSCYVYDGADGNYRPGDTVIPQSILGKVKVGGENIVRNRTLNYVIVRSSPAFGRGNGISLSWLDRLRMALDRGQRVELDPNEVHSFAPIEGLTDLIARVAESAVRNKVIHYGGLTRVSYYEFARQYARAFKYDPNLIVAKSKHPEGSVASKQVYDYSLNSTVAMELLKVKPMHLEEGFEALKQRFVPRF